MQLGSLQDDLCFLSFTGVIACPSSVCNQLFVISCGQMLLEASHLQGSNTGPAAASAKEHLGGFVRGSQMAQPASGASQSQKSAVAPWTWHRACFTAEEPRYQGN